ncbi:MAG: MoxR family ATPase [Salinivirgaceae bacterium]|nr:MoxR family ATPase [Salinivirgaceae bacterium]
MNEIPLFESRIDLNAFNEKIARINQQISSVIVGQQQTVQFLLTALLANGHVLIEGVPGIAKTLLAKLIAKSIDSGFSRIQFTPDLMPSDVLGTTIFNAQKSEFEFRHGPVFSNLVLIDEINRSPAKTQAALFEVMEERQVTIDGKTYPMDLPFLVLATQNPVEHEGTYRLPEAQIDRFIMKINMDYPSLDEEAEILRRAQLRNGHSELENISKQISANDIRIFQQLVHQVIVEEKLLGYIAGIIHRTRNSGSFYLGASPRASQALLNCSKAFALLNGRDFITPEDIKLMSIPVLNHRIILTPEKEMEGAKTAGEIKKLIETIEIPR